MTSKILNRDVEMGDLKYLILQTDPNAPYFGIMGISYKEPSCWDSKNVEYANKEVLCYHLETGEVCRKTVYKNTKGEFFKHKGYGNMYLHNYTSDCKFFPLQTYVIN